MRVLRHGWSSSQQARVDAAASASLDGRASLIVMERSPSRSPAFWSPPAVLVLWLALLLAQVAVLTHDTAATHADDTLCQLCLAGHSVGSAVVAQASSLPPLLATIPALIAAVVDPVRRPAASWQARAPPAFL